MDRTISLICITLTMTLCHCKAEESSDTPLQESTTISTNSPYIPDELHGNWRVEGEDTTDGVWIRGYSVNTANVTGGFDPRKLVFKNEAAEKRIDQNDYISGITCEVKSIQAKTTSVKIFCKDNDLEPVSLSLEDEGVRIQWGKFESLLKLKESDSEE